MFEDILFIPKNTTEIEILPTDPGYHYLRSLMRYKKCDRIIIPLKKDKTYRLVNRNNRLLIWGHDEVVEISEKQKNVLMGLEISTETIHSKIYRIIADYYFKFAHGHGWHISLADYVFKKDAFLHIIEHNDDKYYIFENNLPLPKKFINELIEDGTLVLKN